MQFKLVALLTLAIASVNGVALDKRSGTCTCANNQYSGPTTQAAIDQAMSGTFDGYPRQYPNDEGFTFMCSGPTHHQFPLLANGDHFDGSTSPGPDSVVYDDSGNFCGCITQTGAPGNGFLQCSS